MATVSTQVRLQDGVWTVRVTGVYGIGSEGNEDAAVIGAALEGVLADDPADRVVLDLSAMTYSFGDAIGALFLKHAEGPVDFVLSQACSEAWNGLLALVDPLWADRGERIRFE